jgi:alpha-tubulin suppressor-like RCC1 family protein
MSFLHAGHRSLAVGFISLTAAAGLVVTSAPTQASVHHPRARSATPIMPTSVLAWGNNGDGQLGNGTEVPFATRPVQALRLTGNATTALSGGASHSLALFSRGTVWAWGANESGQLGNGGTSLYVNTPAPVKRASGSLKLQRIVQVAADDVSSAARTQNGQVATWGSNLWGQLGVGVIRGPKHCVNSSDPKPTEANSCSMLPVTVASPSGSGHLNEVVGIGQGENNGLAIRSGGTVWTWGLNDEGQLGIGTTSGPQSCKPYPRYAAVGCSARPVEVKGPGGEGTLDNIVQVSGGESYTLALRSDGTVWAWGSDRFATLGQPSPVPGRCMVPFFGAATPCSTTPVQVSGENGVGFLTNIVAIATSPTPNGISALALQSNGTVWAWGVDDMGQLGNGISETLSSTPVQVLDPQGTGPLTGVVAIAEGGKYSMALLANGTVYDWGINDQGQLGVGNNAGPDHCTTDNVPCSTLPVQVSNAAGTGPLRRVIGAGEEHSLAAVSRP